MPRKRVFVMLLAVLLVASAAYWLLGLKQWSGKQIDHQSLADGIELTIGSFQHPDSESVTVTVVKSRPKQIELLIDFDNLEKASEQQDFIASANRQDAVAMINGGYFDASFQPVGLVVKDIETISEMSNQPALSGVLAVFDSKSVLLIPRSSYLPDNGIRSAIQAGPFLVDPGGKQGIRSDDLKKAKRTAIGQTISGDIVFISTTPCTLYELSEILTKHQNVLSVERFESVLNLDGGPSTGLYLQGLDEYHVVPETDVPNRILMLKR
ncbi:MAG: phosphodiester glycosidase family protein [Phycisphaeraceae bacterium]